MPDKLRLKCYFGCINDGPLHHFPNPNSHHLEDIEKFSIWKAVLDVTTKEKGNSYIYEHIRLCSKHFMDCYKLPSRRLTRNAVPTLHLDGNMNDTNSQSRLVSYEQVKSIMDFMEQHVEFASGHLRTLEARHASKRLWEELAKMVNGCRGGTRKTADGWSKYWSDFKNKLKNKVWLLKRKKSGSTVKGIRPLTKMEKRALVILGPYYEKKKIRQGYTDSQSNNLHPEVKLESFQETVHVNSFNKSDSESIDGLSGGDDQSNDSGESSGEFVNDTDSNAPIMQNIYPQWLIEVEKKRADAELIRAKAEEQRVAIAAKNAEAALLQAEALKRLADTASMQAEGILRIATVMETKGQRDMLAL